MPSICKIPKVPHILLKWSPVLVNYINNTRFITSMKTNEVTISSKDIVQIRQDIELIKNHLLEETELTDWAKKELEEAE